MRLTVAAGLIMGLALGAHVALGAHAKGKVAPAASSKPVHEIAPWYIAMNAGHSGGNRAGVRGASAVGPWRS